jgi:hypothetical protein
LHSLQASRYDPSACCSGIVAMFEPAVEKPIDEVTA